MSADTVELKQAVAKRLRIEGGETDAELKSKPAFSAHRGRRAVRRNLTFPVGAMLFGMGLVLVVGCRGPSEAQSKALPEVARLKQALLGNWAIDQEATADSMARGQFGPQSSVTVSRSGDRPATIRTNFTNKPFNQQEYERAKGILLESFRANDRHTWMTFAPDGTGTESELGGSGTRSNVVQFHWSLQNTTLKVGFPNKAAGADFQTEFTNSHQLCRPMPFLRGCMFFKRAGGTEK